MPRLQVNHSLLSAKIKAFLRLDTGIGKDIPPEPHEQMQSLQKRAATAETERDKARCQQRRRIRELEADLHEQKRMRDVLLTDAFARRAPWVSGVEIDGKLYGKSSRHNNPRLAEFFKAFPEASAGRVLETGSLEGALSLELAERAREVVGLEARPESVERAEFLKDLFGKQNITFHVSNLEEDDLSSYGHFDAIFCCGLLYHLPQPRPFVQHMASTSDSLYLDTHFAPENWQLTERDGLSGYVFKEGGWDQPQSGVSEDSFWPTRSELERLLYESGYTSIETISTHPNNRNGPRVHIAASHS